MISGLFCRIPYSEKQGIIPTEQGIIFAEQGIFQSADDLCEFPLSGVKDVPQEIALTGNGLQMSNLIQRAWRDVNTVGRHVSLNWDSEGSMYGQMALGLEPRGQY
jgi:hypothetical protein